MIVLRLLGSAWFHAPYRKSCIRTYYWIIYLFVTAIMHSTASQVFLCLVIFIISRFYQLINFLANCQHLRSSQTSTRLLVCVIFIDCYLKVIIPRTSGVYFIYGPSQIEIIRQYGVTVQVQQLNIHKNLPIIAIAPRKSYENCKKVYQLKRYAKIVW